VELEEKNLDTEAVLTRNVTRYSEVVDDKEFVQRLVRGVLKAEEKLDDFIQPLAPEWPLDQIARIDKIILRIGVWELMNTQEVPVKVVINESVELAKGFGADNSSKFVNGVLGTAARNLGVVTGKDAIKPAKKTTKDDDTELIESKEK